MNTQTDSSRTVGVSLSPGELDEIIGAVQDKAWEVKPGEHYRALWKLKQHLSLCRLNLNIESVEESGYSTEGKPKEAPTKERK